ncbi:MAG: TIGR03009 domain-containing protein [Rhodopirellula sp.]|nr:TIGR03009 domain-containing protein [Rhodopirellula sp.]
MWQRTNILVSVVVLISAARVSAQTAPQGRPSPQPYASTQNRPSQQTAPPQQVPARFQLTPHENAELNRALKVWEQASNQVKTFESDFHRFTYDAAFGDPTKPIVDQGHLMYSAPDKGMFRVEGPRPEHWICDGKAIFEYNFQSKQLVEHRLPPELHGKAISDGPLPFLFGANAEKLKQRYFMRITTPPDKNGKEVWLEAYPRFQQDAANFQSADVILSVGGMQPTAVQIWEPGGKQRKVYEFKGIQVNQKNLFGFLKGDPFVARLPGLDWKHVVEEAPAAAEARRR